jgi:hypothetical protein
MLELTDKQLFLVADKLFDAGNLAAGALVFGQFLGSGAFSLRLAAIGMAVWLTFLACSVFLAGRVDS